MATAEETLKNQFQLLQEQQQKKLLRRKQRKEEQQQQQRAHTASVISTSKANGAFGVADDLELKLAEPSKGFLSEELVDHLNEQIRELKDENGRVYKLLSERDFELRQVKKKWEEEKAALAATGGPVTNETAGLKIVELSKKIREMTAELETEKNKSRQANKKCHELQRQINSMNSDNKSIRASTISLRSSIEEKQDDPSEVKVLQDKLKQMESKLVDYRNNNSTLKQELRLAHKALAQEVGDNINIQSVLNSTSTWRGRSQQILQLQQKNEELKQEVQKFQGKQTNNLEDEMLGTKKRSAIERQKILRQKEKMLTNEELKQEVQKLQGTQTSNLEDEMLGTKKRSAIDRHKEKLKKLEKEKKDAQTKMVSEKEALEEENYQIKHKLEASKTRNQVLSNEIKSLKKQIPQLLQKNEHDNELIEALMKDQTNLRQQLDEARKNQHNIKLEQQSKINEISAQQQHHTNVVEQLKKIVTDKEMKVHVLENEIQQLKLAHLQRTQANKMFPQQSQSSSQFNMPPPPTQAFVDSRPSTGFETVDLQYNVDSPSQSRMSEVPLTNGNIEPTAPLSAPPSRGPGGDLVKPPSRGASRGITRRPSSANRPSSASHTVDNKMLSDLQYQCEEYKTVVQVAEVERDKLSELMKVLQHRNDEMTKNLQDCQRELVEQRRRNALLEKQLGKVNLGSARPGNTSARRKQTGKSALISSAPLIEDEELTNLSPEELVTNLEIQKDENEALKAALNSTLKAKEEDLKIYSDTIDETKKVFLQALRQLKQSVNAT